MIRVAGPGHCEDRTVSAGCNPYLGLAAMLAAGLDGIERQARSRPAEPGQHVRAIARRRSASGGIKMLPQSLHEALDELQARRSRSRGPGRASPTNSSNLKTKEWETYDRQVTPWEVEQYLTFF